MNEWEEAAVVQAQVETVHVDGGEISHVLGGSLREDFGSVGVVEEVVVGQQRLLLCGRTHGRGKQPRRR